jgi:PKD repeat protein
MIAFAILGLLVLGCEKAPNPTEAPHPDQKEVSSLAKGSALASGPGKKIEPNDTCPTAHDLGTITLPFTLNSSLDGFPFPNGDIDFFRFEGTPNTVVKVDLEGQSTNKGTLGDPLLGYFDSACNQIAAANDGGIGLNAGLAITIPADGVFVLAVTQCCDFGFDQGGSGTYQLTIQEFLPPSNDNFANATAIPALPFSNTVDITAASIESGEPTPSCATFYGPISRTAWYSFAPTATGSISASIINAPFSTVGAAYTGNSLANLTEVGCRAFGGKLTFRAETNTTYYFQVGGLFGQGGPLEFILEVTPPPVANFGFSPFDPSVFDVVQFFDFSSDPGEVGVQSRVWDFGDGTTTTTTECCPSHQYAADGDYAVQLTVTTVDGRTASTSQTVLVRTHDVAITKFTVPKSASAGQTRSIVVGINSKRYPETVEVQLFKSIPGGFQFVGSLSQSVPVRPSNRTTDFNFSYTFTDADAQVGKVTFKAVANIIGARDALPADNEAIAPPTKVSR